MRPLAKRLDEHPYWVGAAVLAVLNGWLSWRLFRIEYFDHFNSIEGSFIGIARYLSRHWSDHSWWPLWQCGMPYQDTYVPLLHLITAAVATIGKISAAHAYHLVIGIFYALGPVTLYLMAAYLGTSRMAAFLSALLYSLFSPSALLMRDVAIDIGGIRYARRLQVLTVYGEGPHISVMTLLPLAILALGYAVHKRNGRAFALAGLCLAVVFLTNVPGTMATGLAVFCWLACQPAGNNRRAWILAGGAAVFGYAIACYGIPPLSELTTLANIGPMHAGFSAGGWWGKALLVLLLAAVFGIGQLLVRTRLDLPLRWALLYFILLTPMVLTANPVRFELLPQVGRLHLEMELAVCLIVGATAWFLCKLSPAWMLPLWLVVLLAGSVSQVRHYRAQARIMLAPADLSKHSEYVSARWVADNLPGQRVYVTGSESFWWNAFTESPQVLGCCDQGQSLRSLTAIPYIVHPATGPDHELLTKGYLETFGAQAIVVSGPDSTEDYKDIKDPQRFDKMLPLLHRGMGDAIYAVPQRSHSLAHVIALADVVPPHPDDYRVYAFSKVIEDESRPLADFQWTANGSAVIRGSLAPADLILVQIPWLSGWKAAVAGRPIPISADGLGFQVLRPSCNGPCEISLQWTGRADRIPSMLISLFSLGLVIVLVTSRSLDHVFDRIG